MKNELTIDVGLNLKVDDSTVNACLKLVEVYINQNHAHVENVALDDGRMVLEIVRDLK